MRETDGRQALYFAAILLCFSLHKRRKGWGNENEWQNIKHRKRERRTMNGPAGMRYTLFLTRSLSVISFKPDQDMRARTLVYWNNVSSIYSQLVTSLRAIITQWIRLFFWRYCKRNAIAGLSIRCIVFPRKNFNSLSFQFHIFISTSLTTKYKLHNSRS